MKIRHLFLMSLLFFALAIAAQAQTRFTSAYSNLGKTCKTLRGPEGTDDASLCKGVGGYEIRIYGSAAAMYINAELKGTDESFNLAMIDFGFDDSKSRVEWRLANGQPFAVILRIPAYAEEKEIGSYFGKVVGQRLVVRGLKGQEIFEEIDAALPGANAKARELADNAYKAAKK